MKLEIISADEVMFTGEVTSVRLPGVQGSFTVLNNHASLVSVLQKGNVVYHTPEGEEHSLQVKGGLADVDNNKIAVCIY